jgi:diaminopimelate decarboxylase
VAGWAGHQHGPHPHARRRTRRAPGAGFDVASRGEIALCRRLGVAPELLCFGNPIRSTGRARSATPRTCSAPANGAGPISRCLLPRGLAIGERINLLATGAYTASDASVAFSGFPPIGTWCVPHAGDGGPA